MDKELAGFGWYIKRIDNALAREACRNVQSHNLTMQQSHLLFVLSDAENHTRTLKELESIFGCAQSTLAGLVTRLEKKGLVEGFTDPRDRKRRGNAADVPQGHSAIRKANVRRNDGGRKAAVPAMSAKGL